MLTHLCSFIDPHNHNLHIPVMGKLWRFNLEHYLIGTFIISLILYYISLFVPSNIPWWSWIIVLGISFVFTRNLQFQNPSINKVISYGHILIAISIISWLVGLVYPMIRGGPYKLLYINLLTPFLYFGYAFRIAKIL